jgi:6-phosphogluconolactonase (cycloisomerase 2 family)
LLIVSTSSWAQSSFVYTNDNASPQTTGAPNSVSAFRVNSDGTLSLLPGSPFTTGGNGSNGGRIAANDITIVQPAGSAADVKLPVLYAVNQGDGTISAFRISTSTGNLSPLHGSPFLIDGPPGGDYSIAASPNAALLFVTNDSTTVIRIYSISPAGTLSQIQGSPFETSINWLGLKVTADGRFLLAGEATGNNVGVFRIARNGSLSAVAGSPFPGSGHSAGVTANCGGNLAFHIDTAHDVDVYSMDSNGTLSPVPGSPFLTVNGFNAGLALSPNNQFLFVTDPFGNNGSSNISAFAVGQDGTLSPVPGSPFPAAFGPGGVAATTTSRDGKFLFSYMFVFSQVDVQMIGADGALTDLGSFFTGLAASGSGMGIASFPAPSCR